jgi:hypothetical protein
MCITSTFYEATGMADSTQVQQLIWRSDCSSTIRANPKRLDTPGLIASFMLKTSHHEEKPYNENAFLKQVRDVKNSKIFSRPVSPDPGGPQPRGVAQLVARLVRDQEVAGSNPAAPRVRVARSPRRQVAGSAPLSRWRARQSLSGGKSQAAPIFKKEHTYPHG